MIMYQKKLLAWCGVMVSAILAFHFAHAQQAKQYVNHKHTLAIGDTVPDFALRFNGQHGGQTAKLSDFKGKLVIFDFWGKNCPSCIKAIPKMEALQETFGDKLQIIMVTKDDSAAIAKLAERSPLVRNLRLPSVVGDTTITKLMEYQSMPVHAWIDGDRVLRYFTVGMHTSAETIAKFFEGNNLQFGVTQQYADFDWQAPLLTEGEGRLLKHVKYYSVIMGKIENSGPYSRVPQDRGDGTAIIKCVNVSMVGLYLIAFGSPLGLHSLDSKRVVVESDDADLYRRRSYGVDENVDEWRKDNLFCYEASVPVDKKEKVMSMMQRDLENYFGFTAEVEERTVKMGMAVVRTDPSKALYQKGDPRNMLLMRSDGTMGTYLYGDLPYLVNELQYFYPDYIVADHTGVEKAAPIHLELKAPLKDKAAFREELQRYGLDLVEGEMKIKMLVLRKIG